MQNSQIKRYNVNSNRTFKFGQEHRYMVFCFAYIFFIVADQLKIISIPQLYFLVFSGLFLLSCESKYFIPTLSLIIPLSIWISLYYIFGLALMIYIIRFNRQIKIPIGIFLMFVVMIVDLLSFIYGEFSVYQWLRMTSYYIGITFFVFGSKEDVPVKKVLLSFTAGYLTVCIVSLIMVVPVVGMENLVANYRFGSGNLKKIIEPLNIIIMFENEIGIYSGIVFSLMLVLMRSASKGKLIYFVVSIFSIFMTMLAKSNTGFALIAFASLCYLWSIRRSAKQFIVYTLVLAGIAGITYWFVDTHYPQLFDSILRRMLVNDISNGRKELLKLYFLRMLNNPKFILLGTGSQNYAQKLNMVLVSHNAAQEVFVMWGAIGLALVAAVVGNAWRFISSGLASRSQLFLSSIPFIVLLLGTQATHFDNSFPLLLPTLYAIRLREDMGNKKENVKSEENIENEVCET